MREGTKYALIFVSIIFLIISLIVITNVKSDRFCQENDYDGKAYHYMDNVCFKTEGSNIHYSDRIIKKDFKWYFT